jgi:hypothetical protein
VRITTDIVPAKRRFGWQSIALAAFALISGLLMLLGPSPLRAVVVFGFLLYVPGAALVRLLALRDMTASFILSVAFSLVLDTIVAMVLLYAGMWSYTAAMAVLIAITLVGALLPVPSQAHERVETAAPAAFPPAPNQPGLAGEYHPEAGAWFKEQAAARPDADGGDADMTQVSPRQRRKGNR